MGRLMQNKTAKQEVTIMSDDNNNKTGHTDNNKTDTTPELTQFEITERADEMQIVAADPALQNILVYEVKGKRALTSVGVRSLILDMARQGESMSVSNLLMNLDKRDPDDQETWIWYAYVESTNLKTKAQTFGLSEAWYLMRHKDGSIGKYDTFGRTKASTKAERNANQKQIHMDKVLLLQKTVESVNLRNLDGEFSNSGGNGDSKATRAPSDKQLNYLKGLFWTWPAPTNMQDAGDLISAIKNTSLDEAKKDKRWAPLLKSDSLICDCENKQIEENPQDNGPNKGKYLCANCNRPIHGFISDALIANRKAKRAAAELDKKK